MKLTINWRDTPRGAWKRCYSDWSFEDVAFLNKTVGYEKYRVVRAVAS